MVRDTVNREVVYYHEFAVPDVLEIGGKYRFVATSPDGVSASANLTVPDHRPGFVPRAKLDICHTGEPISAQERQLRSNVVPVDIVNTDRLSKVDVVYGYSFTPSTESFDYLPEAETDGDTHRIPVNPQRDLYHNYDNDPDNREHPHIPSRVFVEVRAPGPEWPGLDYSTGTVDDIADNSVFSTVEGGTGVVYAFVDSRGRVATTAPPGEGRPPEQGHSLDEGHSSAKHDPFGACEQ